MANLTQEQAAAIARQMLYGNTPPVQQPVVQPVVAPPVQQPVVQPVVAPPVSSGYGSPAAQPAPTIQQPTTQLVAQNPVVQQPAVAPVPALAPAGGTSLAAGSGAALPGQNTSAAPPGVDPVIWAGRQQFEQAKATVAAQQSQAAAEIQSAIQPAVAEAAPKPKETWEQTAEWRKWNLPFGGQYDNQGRKLDEYGYPVIQPEYKTVNIDGEPRPKSTIEKQVTTVGPNGATTITQKVRNPEYDRWLKNTRTYQTGKVSFVGEGGKLLDPEGATAFARQYRPEAIVNEVPNAPASGSQQTLLSILNANTGAAGPSQRPLDYVNVPPGNAIAYSGNPIEPATEDEVAAAYSGAPQYAQPPTETSTQYTGQPGLNLDYGLPTGDVNSSQITPARDKLMSAYLRGGSPNIDISSVDPLMDRIAKWYAGERQSGMAINEGILRDMQAILSRKGGEQSNIWKQILANTGGLESDFMKQNEAALAANWEGKQKLLSELNNQVGPNGAWQQRQDRMLNVLGDPNVMTRERYEAIKASGEMPPLSYGEQEQYDIYANEDATRSSLAQKLIGVGMLNTGVRQAMDRGIRNQRQAEMNALRDQQLGRWLETYGGTTAETIGNRATAGEGIAQAYANQAENQSAYAKSLASLRDRNLGAIKDYSNIRGGFMDDLLAMAEAGQAEYPTIGEVANAYLEGGGAASARGAFGGGSPGYGINVAAKLHHKSIIGGDPYSQQFAPYELNKPWGGAPPFTASYLGGQKWRTEPGSVSLKVRDEWGDPYRTFVKGNPGSLRGFYGRNIKRYGE